MSEPNVPASVPAVPDYLKAYISQPSTDAQAMAASSVSIPRVSLRAKKFRFIENGEEVFVEPETHVVILSVEPEPGKFVKTFYQGTYNSGDSSPPACSSSNGINPDSWVTNPQSQFCSTCPQNVFGSATSRTGKKAKACRDSKRLWVVRPDNIQGTVYGLGVPVTSLKELSALGQKLLQFGAPISAAVVKLSMDEDESFPTLYFTIAGWLKEEHGKVAIERNQAKDWTGALQSHSAGPALGAPTAAPTQALPSRPPQAPADPAPSGASAPPIEGQVTGKSNNVDDALANWTS